DAVAIASFDLRLAFASSLALVRFALACFTQTSLSLPDLASHAAFSDLYWASALATAALYWALSDFLVSSPTAAWLLSAKTPSAVAQITSLIAILIVFSLVGFAVFVPPGN